MKRIEDCKVNECIYIESKEDWEKIVPVKSLSHSIQWEFKSKCYFPSGDCSFGLKYATSEGFIIHNAKDFLEETFEVGEKVKVSANGLVWYEKEYYVGKTKSGKYVTEDDHGRFTQWVFIEKIDKGRLEAIETVKELLHKYKIDVKELK